MLNRFPTFARLLFCLLISTGLHGGFIYYGRVAAPVQVQPTNAPVEVSLLPAVEVAPALMKEASPPLPKPVEPVKAPLKQNTKPVPPKKVAEVKEVEPMQHQPKLPRPSIMETEEVACEPPRDVSCTEPSKIQTASLEISADTEPLASPQEATADPMPPVVSTKGAADSVSEQALIEAVPRYGSNPLPEYPYLARQRHWEGVVWLLVDVSSEGVVEDLKVEQSSGYKILDRSASRSVRTWRFVPATRAGLPVPSQARIPVRFRLEGG